MWEKYSEFIVFFSDSTIDLHVCNWILYDSFFFCFCVLTYLRDIFQPKMLVTEVIQPDFMISTYVSYAKLNNVLMSLRHFAFKNNLKVEKGCGSRCNENNFTLRYDLGFWWWGKTKRVNFVHFFLIAIFVVRIMSVFY